LTEFCKSAKNKGNKNNNMTEKKDILTFKPKEVTKQLISSLSDRAQDILLRRYGLGKSTKRMTLEAIGAEYGITRERVRQIENFALSAIRKSNEYKEATNIFAELSQVMDYYGGIVHEQEFLQSVAKDSSAENHIHFLLVISEAFTKLKETNKFHHRWTTDKDLANQVHSSIEKLCENISPNDLVSESKLVTDFLVELADIAERFKEEKEAVAKRWLVLSKELDQNPMGEWGLSTSPNVRMRGIRDYAYLVLRDHGSPMHFTEVAQQITNIFKKKAHPATCHNELIKDPRFVLVGRGLYALTEWGYTQGVVAEVIRVILKEEGALTKEEIINRVKKERYVKDNTILVNLQNPNYFKKDDLGRFEAV